MSDETRQTSQSRSAPGTSTRPDRPTGSGISYTPPDLHIFAPETTQYLGRVVDTVGLVEALDEHKVYSFPKIEEAVLTAKIEPRIRRPVPKPQRILFFPEKLEVDYRAMSAPQFSEISDTNAFSFINRNLVKLDCMYAMSNGCNTKGNTINPNGIPFFKCRQGNDADYLYKILARRGDTFGYVNGERVLIPGDINHLVQSAMYDRGTESVYQMHLPRTQVDKMLLSSDVGSVPPIRSKTFSMAPTTSSEALSRTTTTPATAD